MKTVDEMIEILQRISADGNGHYPLVLPSYVPIGDVEASERHFKKDKYGYRDDHSPRRVFRIRGENPKKPEQRFKRTKIDEWKESLAHQGIMC